MLIKFDTFDRLLLLLLNSSRISALIKQRNRELYEEMLVLEIAAHSDNYSIEKLSKRRSLVCSTDSYVEPFKLILRRGTSDFGVFRQIFILKEHKPLLDKIDASLKREDIKYIIDAGAYIGCTPILFKKAFPNSTLIAIEPVKETYVALQENMRMNGLGEVVLLNRALWIDNSYLDICKDFRDKKEWAFYVKPCSCSSTVSVKGITIAEILNSYKFPYIDILKIDIEGAERFIFENEGYVKQFLPLVRYLAMEIHGEYKMKDKILGLLDKFGFTYFYSQELLIAQNQRFGRID